jgi:hypothetical protein
MNVLAERSGAPPNNVRMASDRLSMRNGSRGILPGMSIAPVQHNLTTFFRTLQAMADKLDPECWGELLVSSERGMVTVCDAGQGMGVPMLARALIAMLQSDGRAIAEVERSMPDALRARMGLL